MSRPNLFIGIGVHKARGMLQLDGVLTSLDELCDWASSQNYDVVKIDDRLKPVTVDRIKEELTPLNMESGKRDYRGLLDRRRIILYFCGHGLHVPSDQYWVLSPGPNQPDDRISLSGFRDMLASYGPKQLAVISDACRTPVFLRGLARSVVDLFEGLSSNAEKDNFWSSQDGEASFAISESGGQPAYCVFSRVLSDALSQPIEDALDPTYLEKGRKVVSSESLSIFLGQKVPDVAIETGNWQVPECRPGFFSRTDDRYVEFDGNAAVPNSTMTKTAKDLSQQQSAAKLDAQIRRLSRSRSEWRKPYLEYITPFMDVVLDTMAKRGSPILVSSNTDEAIWYGFGVKEPIAATDMLNHRVDRQDRLLTPTLGLVNGDRSFVGVVNVADLYAAIPFYRGLWCAIIFEKSTIVGQDGGVEFIAWGSGEKNVIDGLSAAEALKGLSNGVLSAEDVVRFAAAMRKMKHTDPLYGIVAAYLYHAIGDVANIRRTACYYAMRGQDVPFDVAFLAGVPLKPREKGGFFVEIPAVPASPEGQRANLPSFVWEETPAKTVGVAGVTPLLRAGWQYLLASKYDIHRKCSEITGYLTESPVAAVVGADAGNRLIEILRGDDYADGFRTRYQQREQ